jgi:hypothetical protein
MQMLYNSDSFAVVRFDMPAAGQEGATRGGYEIVDKFARTDIFLDGALAETFQNGVAALMEQGEPSQEDFDAFIGRFTALMPQPLVLH